MRHLKFILALLLFAPGPVQAQPDSEPPLRGRPAQFSEVVGAYLLEVEATPTEAAVEEPITLRVRLIGRGPEKYQPRRESLRIFPEDWDDDFYVEPVPEADRANPAEGEWEFVYLLRPRHQQVEAIDGLRLVYYSPAQKRFQTTYAEPIPLQVSPRRAVALPDELPVLAAPASFYELADLGDVLEPRTGWFAGWLPFLLLVVPPLLTVAAVRAWLTVFPDEATRRRRQRSLAGRRALQQLQDESEPPWLIVNQYLGERLAFPAAEATPVEVRQFLRRLGVARPLCAEFETFYRACDAARFAPSAAETATLRAEAARLIHALEAERCLH